MGTVHYLAPPKAKPKRGPTPNQLMMLSDAIDAGIHGIWPLEAGELATARALVKRGLCDWQGRYLHATPAGIAFLK